MNKIFVYCITLLMFAGCGGGGSNNSTEGENNVVELTSLTGTIDGALGLVVLQNGSETLEVNEDGPITIDDAIPIGTEYEVTVKRSPIGQTCHVRNGFGVAEKSSRSIEITCNEAIYVPLTDRDHGQELWVTDGTEAGTQLFMDTRPGAAGSFPMEVMKFADKLVYFALNAESKIALYLSDGTVEGTQEVSEIYYRHLRGGELDRIKTKIKGFATLWKEKLYFQRSLTDGSAELVELDQSGNVETKISYDYDIFGDQLQFFDLSMRSMGDRLVYQQIDGSLNLSIHSFDGAQTIELASRVAFERPSFKATHSTSDKYYFFSITSGFATSVEGALWETDGTIENTKKVEGSNDELSGYLSGSFVNNEFFYVGGFQSQIIKKIDNETGKPKLLYDFGEDEVLIEAFLGFNNQSYFLGLVYENGEDGVSHRKGLFKIEEFSIEQVLETNSIDYPLGFMTEYIELDSKLFLLSVDMGLNTLLGSSLVLDTDASLGVRLYSYSSDGQVEILEEHAIEANDDVSKLGMLRKVGGRLFYVGDAEGFGSEPFISDGSPNSGTLLQDINTTNKGSYLWLRMQAGQGVIAQREFPDSENKYHFVGIKEGASEDLGVSTASSYGLYDTFVEVGELTYFVVSKRDAEGNYQYELFHSDGTSAGTHRVSLTPQSDVQALPEPDRVLHHNGDLFLATIDFPFTQLLRLQLDKSEPSLVTATFISELESVDILNWLTTESGYLVVSVLDEEESVLMVFDSALNLSNTISAPGELELASPMGLKVIGDDLFFWAGDFERVLNLYKVNLGSLELELISGGWPPNDYGGREVFVLDNEIVALAYGNIHIMDDGNYLKLSDYRLSDTPGIEFDGALYVSARRAADDSEGYELWRYKDGEMKLVKDIFKGTEGSYPRDFVLFNNQMFFAAQDSSLGSELWKTDGTSEGTVLLKDINPGFLGASPGKLFVLDEHSALFTADDHVHGDEVWITDGTAEGTRLFFDEETNSNGSWERLPYSCSMDFISPSYKIDPIWCWNPFDYLFNF